MKVILFAYSHGKASGGHYHSLDQLSREIGRHLEVHIVTFGSVSSPVLANNPHYHKHIPFEKGIANIQGLNQDIGKICKVVTPDLLHCFDTESLNWLLLLPSTRRFPVVMNKCGGPNPQRSNWQHANGLVLFSKENYDWFVSNSNYDSKTLHLIPNRVNKLSLLPVERRVEAKDTQKINFLRVSRLGGAYEKTLWDTLNMVEVLSKTHPVHLYVIGRIQDSTRFAAFEQSIADRSLPVTIITDERASRGADFLYLADFVIGTGRSFMEALSLGIPSLTPAENMDWPVLVTQENFEVLFSTNFSERNRADADSVKENEQRLRQLLDDPIAYQKARDEAHTLFTSHFSIEAVGIKYRDVYRSVLAGQSSRLPLIVKNLPYLIKTLLAR